MFDVNAFLDQTSTEANSTVVIPVPVGEYTAIAESVTPRPWTSKDDPTKSGVTLEVLWSIDDQEVKTLLGREKVTVKQGVMLDLTADGSGLDYSKGRNVSLGRLREAIGLNTPGQPFAPSMIPGRMAKVRVDHRADKNDPSVLYAEVRAVTKL